MKEEHKIRQCCQCIFEKLANIQRSLTTKKFGIWNGREFQLNHHLFWYACLPFLLVDQHGDVSTQLWAYNLTHNL
jgi:hypothetical protein